MNPNFLNVLGEPYRLDVERSAQEDKMLVIKKWAFQIDRDLFGTEALYLVVAVYWWGWHMKEVMEGQKIGR
jgi:hypothetical protein